jgi:hypothetical protein
MKKGNKLVINKKLVFKVLLLCAVSGLVYAAPADMPEEITKIHQGTKGYMTGISYIVASASAIIGLLKFVETQNFKIGILAGGVSILAFKFPGWVVAAAVI